MKSKITKRRSSRSRELISSGNNFKKSDPSNSYGLRERITETR